MDPDAQLSGTTGPATPAPAFRLVVDHATGSVVLGGELDRRNRHLLLEGLRSLASTPHDMWRIDLADVVFCDSGGLSGLVEGHGLARRNGRRLSIARCSPCVHRLLVDAGLAPLLCEPELLEAGGVPGSRRRLPRLGDRRSAAPLGPQGADVPPGVVRAATIAG